MISFFDTFHFLCTKILGNIRWNCISNGYKNQWKNVLYPHRCRITGKCLCTEWIYNCLYDHHANWHCRLLKNRWHSDPKHGMQFLPIKPVKMTFISTHPAKENQKWKHCRNPLRNEGCKSCTKYPQTKSGHHPEIHKNIQNRRKYQQSQWDLWFTDRGKHRWKDVIHKQKRKSHKINTKVQYCFIQYISRCL